MSAWFEGVGCLRPLFLPRLVEFCPFLSLTHRGGWVFRDSDGFGRHLVGVGNSVGPSDCRVARPLCVFLLHSQKDGPPAIPLWFLWIVHHIISIFNIPSCSFGGGAYTLSGLMPLRDPFWEPMWLRPPYTCSSFRLGLGWTGFLGDLPL